MTRRRGGAGLVGSLVLVGVLSGCSSSGVSAAADDEDFVACVESAGGSVPDDADAAGELAFWAEPGVLACAVDELDGDRLEAALGDAFADPEEADDYVRTALAQQAAVRVLAADVAGTDGEDAAVAALGRFLAAVPTGSDRTLRRVAALGIVEATDGLPDYQDYLDATGQQDGPEAFVRYDGQVQDEGPDALRERLRGLSTRLRDDS